MNTSTVTSTITDLAESITSTVNGAVADITDTVTKTVNNTVTNTVKRFDPSKLEVPRFQMPAFQMPVIQVPTFERPTFELPVDTDRITELARDAAYVGVGAIVVVAQQADETARSVAGTLTESVSTRVRELVGSIR